MANWNVKNPRLPESWKKAGTNWLWWQHGSGNVSGIQGNVDLDLVNPPSTSKGCCSIL